MKAKPWDARAAALLVRPFIDTRLHPNALTTLRLLVGLAGAWLFASGSQFNLAALCIVLSNFLDHTDGELARMSGKMSVFGHRYDLFSDALVTVGLFAGLGIGLRATLGDAATIYGFVAGIAVAGIFQLRHVIESQHGKAAVKQASFAGFETEDVLYLIPFVTLSGQEVGFLYAAAIGAPIALIVVALQFIRTSTAGRR